MDGKPENFVVTTKDRASVIERHFDLPGGDFVAYRITLKPPQEDNVSHLQQTLLDLHRGSADSVIRYLLRLLPEGYDAQEPYRGQLRQETKTT